MKILALILVIVCTSCRSYQQPTHTQTKFDDYLKEKYK